MTNVLHVTSWISRNGGGIPPVVWAYAREFARLGARCCVAGLDDEFVLEDCKPHRLPYLAAKLVGPRSFGFSSHLRGLLHKSLASGGVVHSHGLWMYPGVLARKIAGEIHCPLIVSPHGMLEPWALQNSWLKKNLALRLFESKNLHRADCLHALCHAEAQNLRQFGLRNPIAVIPNGVDLPQIGNQEAERRNQKSEIKNEFQLSAFPISAFKNGLRPLTSGKKVLLYLGRIHPKKGLVNLLKAWEALRKAESTKHKAEEWVLAIVGLDQDGHEAELKRLATELGIPWSDIRDQHQTNSISAFSFQHFSVLFFGPQFGEAKAACYASSDAFVLPSFSEGFSMAVLEAAACGLPVLDTPQCNFPELAAAGGAIEAQPTVDGCAAGLRQMFSLSDLQRKNMGLCGRELIQKAYTWPAIAAEMAKVYAWLLRQGPKPDCVI